MAALPSPFGPRSMTLPGYGALQVQHAPPKLSTVLQARQAGIGIDPTSGRVTGRIYSPTAEEHRRAIQDLTFAKAVGLTSGQLGLGTPGNPALYSTKAGQLFGIGQPGGRNIILRPEQYEALGLLPSGASSSTSSTPVLSQIGGSSMSGSFGRSAAPGASPTPARGSRPSTALLLAAGGAALLLFLLR